MVASAHAAPISAPTSVDMPAEIKISLADFIPSKAELDIDEKKWVQQPTHVYIVTKDAKEYKERKITVKEFEKEKNFRWIEGIITSSYVKEKLAISESKGSVSLPAEIKKIIKFYFENIQSISENTVLLDTGDKDYVTLARAEINSDDVVAFYAGKMSSDRELEAELCLEYGKKSEIQAKPWRSESLETIDCITDAKEYGNMSRHMPHLPTAKELQAADLPGLDLSKVATVNLEEIHRYIGYKSAHFFKATENIPIHNIYGISYGQHYWYGQKKPFWLYDKEGNKLLLVRYNKYREIIRAEEFKEEEVVGFGIVPGAKPKKSKLTAVQFRRIKSLMDDLVREYKEIDARKNSYFSYASFFFTSPENQKSLIKDKWVALNDLIDKSRHESMDKIIGDLRRFRPAAVGAQFFDNRIDELFEYLNPTNPSPSVSERFYI